MTLEEAVKLIAESPKDDAVKALQKGAGGVVQTFFNNGHAVGLAKNEDDLKDAKKKVEDLTAQVEERDKLVTDLKGKTPDVAKLHEQYQGEIKTLKDKLADQKREFEAQRDTAAMETFKSDLRARLIAGGVDPDYTDVLIGKLSTANRLTVKNGVVSVLQAGKDIPIVAEDGKLPMDALVAEVVPTVPAKWMVSGADHGAGSGGGSGAGGSGGGAGSGDFFQKIRDKKAAELKAQAEQRDKARSIFN